MFLKSCIYFLICTAFRIAAQQAVNSIFSEVDDFCDIECGGQVHTMCSIEDPKPQCEGFILHSLETERHEELKKDLIQGHNGVRNRIAERMHVPNMLKMAWDRNLARMAENFLYRCKDHTIDPCTLMPEILYENETIDAFFDFNVSHLFIAQNKFFEESHFYPYQFLERVIRSWYFEKDGMRVPTTKKEDTYSMNENKTMQRLLGENNFTHFAYPFVYRFGCAMAKFGKGFHLLCNYFPYFRTATNTMYFSTSSLSLDCPASFPLRDEMFSYLCTDESDEYLENHKADDKTNAQMLISLSLLTLLAAEFIVIWSYYYF